MPGITELKRRAGNRGGRPVSIGRTGLVPDLPEDFGPAGQAAWVELWQAGSWLSLTADRNAMTILCRNFDELSVYQVEARKRPFVKGSMGQRRVNPAVKEIRVLEASIRSWLDKLHFFGQGNPASAGDDLDAFVGRLPS